MAKHYINCNKIGIEYCTKSHEFQVWYHSKGKVISAARITQVIMSDIVFSLNDIKAAEAKASYFEKSANLDVVYHSELPDANEIRISFMIDQNGLHLFSNACLNISGRVNWGEDMEHSTFAVNLERDAKDIRVAIGPAASTIDHALFDRLTDSALNFTGYKKLKIQYSWTDEAYAFNLNTLENLDHSVNIEFIDNFYANKFGIRYKPINKNNQFPVPPVGWMTWYAVKFDACEAVILENIKFISDKLKDFGVNCIWVDWEWYHSNLEGVETDGSDTFHPSVLKFPHGLKYVSDEIKKYGLTPALWIGATNEPSKNKILEEHPEWVLANKKQWCGQWWIDISHPEVIDNYIPMVFNQILAWGYDVIKWDCLPATLYVGDEYHHQFYDPLLSTEDAFRKVIQSARETIGENNYMVSCSGENERSITFGMDYFDSARIGGDVFSWDEFMKNAFTRMRDYLCFNNVVLYTDPDVVVLRKDFNTIQQAISRASFVSITGLPYTIGDHLPDLNEEEIEVLKSTIPVLDIHPMDLCRQSGHQEVTIINQAIAKRYENYNVIDVFNTTDKPQEICIDIAKELHLEVGGEKEYLLYEYWNKEFLGVQTDEFRLSLAPLASKVICIREKTNHPQLLSVSRHISQGALEIKKLHWDESSFTLSGQSEVIANTPCTITLYIPGNYSLESINLNIANSLSKLNPLLKITFHPTETGVISWDLAFIKR